MQVMLITVAVAYCQSTVACNTCNGYKACAVVPVMVEVLCTPRFGMPVIGITKRCNSIVVTVWEEDLLCVAEVKGMLTRS